MHDARTRDPLDVVLCHGCAAVVEVVTRRDDRGPWFSALCHGCDYQIADGAPTAPPTLRAMLDGEDRYACDDVRMGRLVREIARRLGAR